MTYYTFIYVHKAFLCPLKRDFNVDISGKMLLKKAKKRGFDEKPEWRR